MPSGPDTRDDATLPLGAASRLLGVHPDTLRRWSDEGRVKCFTTPGGHRRFDRRAVERIRRARAREQVSLTGLGLTPSGVVARYRQRYRQHVAGRPDPRAVAGPFELEAFRDEGRRLIDALVRHLEEIDERARAAAWMDASLLVRSHARRLAERNASLIDGVALFVAARQPFLSEVGALARRRALAAPQLTRLLEEATALLDRLLLDFIDGYRTAT